jgi:hypothetical protein
MLWLRTKQTLALLLGSVELLLMSLGTKLCFFLVASSHCSCLWGPSLLISSDLLSLPILGFGSFGRVHAFLCSVQVLSVRRSIAMEKVKKEFVCDGPRAVKDRREAWTEGPRARGWTVDG